MADEPTPPPAEEQDTEREVYPFIEAAAGGGPGVNVRAGWADKESGEATDLVVNYQGSAGSPTAEEMYQAGLEWYRDTVSALARRQQDGAEQ
jgi:hypothetical protein